MLRLLHFENGTWVDTTLPGFPNTTAKIICGSVTSLSPFAIFESIVRIDIKPGSDPNSINLAAQGVVPVAILTTDNFDASQVDPSTVRFAGASAVQSALEDVDHDGDLDLILHFRIRDTNLLDTYKKLLDDCDTITDGALDPGCGTRQQAKVSLTGRTLQGTDIFSSDTADLFLTGSALQDLLKELARDGRI
ncbi:MAG: hypothetical protein HY000_30005 [Planctomycetes bacterium]|nr:hypothetical protein [Planctomycetota bacterium]